MLLPWAGLSQSDHLTTGMDLHNKRGLSVLPDSLSKKKSLGKLTILTNARAEVPWVYKFAQAKWCISHADQVVILWVFVGVLISMTACTAHWGIAVCQGTKIYLIKVL